MVIAVAALLATGDATAAVPGGTYVLDEDTAELEQELEARIAEVTQKKFFMVRGVLRRVLARATQPCRKFAFRASSSDTTVRCDDQSPAIAPVAGEWVPFRGDDGRKMELRLETPRDHALTQTFRSRHGERENHFEWAEDGRAMTVRVTIRAPVLDEPFAYDLRYSAASQLTQRH